MVDVFSPLLEVIKACSNMIEEDLKLSLKISRLKDAINTWLRVITTV